MTDQYIKGPVLSPGLKGRPDIGIEDRPLTAEEIQKAAYSYLPGSPIVDVQHSFKPQAEVVESYITPEDTDFNGKSYPAGTWFITAKVTDPTLQTAIQKSELTGFSVGAFPEKDYEQLKRQGITKGMFSDVDEGSWFALAISIVDVPFYPEMIFKVFRENEFIKKELPKSEADKLSNENTTNDKVSLSVLKDFFNFIKKEAEPIEKADPPVEEPKYVTQEQLDAKLDEIKQLITESKAVEKEAPEETPEEEETTEEPEEQPEETPEPEEEEEDEVISKSLPVDGSRTQKTSFMAKIGRDDFGNKA